MLELKKISRTFNSGQVTALQDISFQCERGSVLGIVGMNGAGKTTLTKICAGLLTPTSGDITCDGISPSAAWKTPGLSIGLVLGGDSGFYPRATVRDNMRFFADLAGIPWRTQQSEISRVLSLTDTYTLIPRKCGELSRGQRQRLHIARALLGAPSLLLLDEPTNGLDPDSAFHIRRLIASLATPERIILLTSHSMTEISELATEIIVLDNSHLIIHGNAEDVLSRAGISHVYETEFPSYEGCNPHIIEKTFTPYGSIFLHPHGSHWKLSIICATEEQAQKAAAHLQSFLPPSHASHSRRQSLIREATLNDAFLSLAQLSRSHP